MTQSVSRSTFAYAAILFALLFAPLVSRDPASPGARTLSAFPGLGWLLAFAAVMGLCVWQSLQNRPADEPRVRRGLMVGSIVSGVAAVLYGIAVAGLAPTVFADAGFGGLAALSGALTVALTGAGFAALFAMVLGRRPRSTERTEVRP